MSAIAANLYARLGNCMFIWAHAKARAEQAGAELRTAEWVGEKIFTLDGHKCERPDDTETETLSGYFQDQAALIYTRADCRRWFKFRPEIDDALAGYTPAFHSVYAHFRRGDYAGAGFPLVSRQSVMRAMEQLGMAPEFCEVSDDHPLRDSRFSGDLEMLPDFYRLMHAPILFRANSSFSWWAATLGTSQVFSPDINGLVGGVENYNVKFIEGNWPRLASFEFTTDLRLKEN